MYNRLLRIQPLLTLVYITSEFLLYYGWLFKK
uniref:Uncharacterized protein n=1 Tax=Anguilla anguilla TaxID=7936 RepID=A0A0E9SQF1_ANGAN